MLVDCHQVSNQDFPEENGWGDWRLMLGGPWTLGQTPGQTPGRTPGRTPGQTPGRTVGRLDGRSDGRPDTLKKFSLRKNILLLRTHPDWTGFSILWTAFSIPWTAWP